MVETLEAVIIMLYKSSPGKEISTAVVGSNGNAAVA
jgi:hypothetical protein